MAFPHKEAWFDPLPHGGGVGDMTDVAGEAFTFSSDWWSLLLYPDAVLAFDAQL